MECKRWRARGRVTSSAGFRAAEQPGSRAAEQAAEQPEQPEQHNGQRAQSAAAVRWQRGGAPARRCIVNWARSLGVQTLSTAEAELATAYGGHARGGGADIEVVGTMVQPSGPPPAPR